MGLQRSTGKRMASPESRIDLMIASTGPTVATVSSWVTDQCLKWAKVDQSILLTTSAKPTRTVKSVSVKSMATVALARLFATLGSTLQSKVTLFLPTQLVPAKESSLSVMFNLSRTHLPTRTTSMRIITLSGAQPASTMSLTKTAPQAVLYQLNTNAAVA